MDRIDREILTLLQQDARRSNREIARRVGVAESTCSSRIRRLEDSGSIVAYRTIVSPEVLGVGLEAVVSLQLVRHTREAITSFWAHAGELNEATRVFHLTGNDDFMIHLLLIDADHLRTVTTEVITTWPEVARFHTSVVFEHRDHPPALPTAPDSVEGVVRPPGRSSVVTSSRQEEGPPDHG